MTRCVENSTGSQTLTPSVVNPRPPSCVRPMVCQPSSLTNRRWAPQLREIAARTPGSGQPDLQPYRAAHAFERAVRASASELNAWTGPGANLGCVIFSNSCLRPGNCLLMIARSIVAGSTMPICRASRSAWSRPREVPRDGRIAVSTAALSDFSSSTVPSTGTPNRQSWSTATWAAEDLSGPGTDGAQEAVPNTASELQRVVTTARTGTKPRLVLRLAYLMDRYVAWPIAAGLANRYRRRYADRLIVKPWSLSRWSQRTPSRSLAHWMFPKRSASA